jgi:hypothetical protein
MTDTGPISLAYDRRMPNPRFDTDPSQQRCAPLFWAGQAQRYASLDRGVSICSTR